jgi:L-methionine (R)-S-oxide reductase
MEQLEIKEDSKEEMYKLLIPQVASLTEGEEDIIANMANVASAIMMTFKHLWVGFYIVRPDNSQFGKSLVLGPFQGPIACTRIAYGKGVCGTSWKEKRSLVVADVDNFPGHIACSSLSRSEIVVPIFGECESNDGENCKEPGEVKALLDIDSAFPGNFDEIDRKYLELLVKYIKCI